MYLIDDKIEELENDCEMAYDKYRDWCMENNKKCLDYETWKCNIMGLMKSNKEK